MRSYNGILIFNTINNCKLFNYCILKGFTSVYNELNHFFDLPENSLSVVEKQISTATKNEYFELSKSLEMRINEVEVIEKKERIFDHTTSREEKKAILVQLASLQNIEAFRTIERFIKQPNIQLYDWAYLALHESKLQIESDLLNEYRLLISSGLGGKGLKLRYFVVMIGNNNELSLQQIQLLNDELEYQLSQVKGELEDRKYKNNIASFLVVIPITIQLDSFFKGVIKECNNVGNFMSNEYFITNLRVLNMDEITELLSINNLY